MPTYKTLAIVDDVHNCDCCGKANLKTTVAMERDDGEVFHFGSVCATRHAGRVARVIRQEAADARQARKAAASPAIKSHPSFSAYQRKLAEARSLGLVGREFADFCRIEREAQSAYQSQVTKELSLEFYEIDP